MKGWSAGEVGRKTRILTGLLCVQVLEEVNLVRVFPVDATMTEYDSSES